MANASLWVSMFNFVEGFAVLWLTPFLSLNAKKQSKTHKQYQTTSNNIKQPET